MDYIIIAFLIIVIVGIKFYKNDEKMYFSKEYTLYLRGILAIAIVFHHIYENRIVFKVFGIFRYIGNFASAMFMFISGYGLMKNITEDKKEYNKKMIKGHIIPLFIEYIIIMGIWYILNNIILKNNEIRIIPHSWFIFMIELYYIFHLIFYNIFQYNKKGIVISNIMVSTIIIMILSYYKVSDFWYISLLSYNCGNIFSLLQNRINKNFINIIILSSIFFIIPELSQLYIKNKVGTDLFIVRLLIGILKNIGGASLCIIMANLGRYIKVENIIFKKIGVISLEIYLLHGFFEVIFKNINIINNNNFLFGLFIIVFTIITAEAIYIIKNKINTIIKETNQND